MRIIVSLCLIGLALCFADCSKKSTSKPASLVSSISNSNGDNWNFTYDGQGRVATILYTAQGASTTKTFQYGNKQLITTLVDQSGTQTVDTLYLNTDGSIARDGSLLNNEDYSSTNSYSNGDLDTSRYVSYYNGVQSTSISTYTYQNGDMIANSGGVTYTYYDNQPSVALDDNTVFEYEQYGNAAHNIECAHMVRTYTTQYGTITFSYIYDSLGRVTEIDIENSTLTSISITWQ